ncbi:MAG: hypothetical protein KBS62_03170, partial [Oscillospiraceae bacterium]|nr:hypothetical protein [Candidatus Ruminococcus equi]
AVLLVAGLVSYIFLAPKTISGDWQLTVNPEISSDATPDEVENSDKTYYKFSNPGEYGDGTYKTFYQGGVEEGEYKLSEKDGKKYIDMGRGEFEYTITGSKILKNAKLTVIYPEYTDEETGETYPSQEYVFYQAQAPDYEKESFDSFEKDEKLLGQWATNERTLTYLMYTLSYTETVNFKDNGIMTIHYESADLALDRYMYYAYTTKDNELEFSLVTNKMFKQKVKYEFDKNGNLNFVDDNTVKSIFFDEVFGSCTFYKPENLPDMTTQSTTVE